MISLRIRYLFSTFGTAIRFHSANIGDHGADVQTFVRNLFANSLLLLLFRRRFGVLYSSLVCSSIVSKAFFPIFFIFRISEESLNKFLAMKNSSKLFL